MLSYRVSMRKLFNGYASTRKKRKVSDSMQLGMDCHTSHRKPKRKRATADKRCQKFKKKQKMGNPMSEKTKIVPVDYISGLPEHIIHHILTFLRCPKDVARTSALSKTWRMIWKSFLTFDFDQKNFKTRGNSQILEFLKYVESSLVSGLATLEYVQKFRLSMTSFDARKMTRRLNRWLANIVFKSVREMELHFVTKKAELYSVPQSVLACESLTTLKLCGCRLNNCYNIKLSNLQNISIKNMQIDMDIIQRFVSGSPLIEDLRLAHCWGLENLHISTLLKITRVEICYCRGLQSVKISAPNLHIFWFFDNFFRGCTIDLDGCHDLRSLSLRHKGMTDIIFQDLISKLPVLETLVLNECDYLNRITILSGKLRKLALVRCRKLIETIVDAPNLHFFEFTGDRVPFFCINAPNRHDVKFSFTAETEHKLNMEEVFGKITMIQGLKLILSCNNEDVVIYEELEAFPDIEFSPYKYYKLELKGPSISSIEHMKNLFRVTHPITVIVYSPSGSKLLKFLQENMMNREKSLDCCSYYSRKCWKHYLKEVSTLSEIYVKGPGNKNLKRTTLFLKWGLMCETEGAEIFN